MTMTHSRAILMSCLLLAVGCGASGGTPADVTPADTEDIDALEDADADLLPGDTAPDASQPDSAPAPPDAATDTPQDSSDTLDEFIPPPELVLLMDHDLWEEVPLTEDPYADHQPEEILCSPEAVYLEGRTIEVDTGLCNYVSLRQPTLEPVEVGDTIEIAYWHGPLISAEVAEAHTAIMLGDEVLWERTIMIPHPGNFFFEEIRLERHIPAGTRLIFHLHNHGINSWMLAYIAKFTPDD